MKKSSVYGSGCGFFFSIGFLLVSTYSVNVMAQAIVVEAGAGTSGGTVRNQTQAINNGPLADSTATAVGSTNDNVVMSLYLQLEAVQDELQTLRGIVEEQSYLIKRMETEQRDRYLDIDRRLSSDLNLTPTNTISSAPITRTVIAEPVVSVQETSPVSTSSLGEQDLYRTALNLLLEDSRYNESIVLFEQYIQNYQGGRFLTNAYYWQGEALILTEDYARAKNVFTRVIDDYPTDAKAAGAMLKLGVAYLQMGDKDLALQTWQRILDEYPNDLPVIRAADDYLRRNGN